MHLAALRGDIGVARGLLVIDTLDPNQIDRDGFTPLGLAVKENKLDVVRVLIERAPRVSLSIGAGCYSSPLHLSVSRLYLESSVELVLAGADVNARDGEGNTPFHCLMNAYPKEPELATKLLRSLIFECKGTAQLNARNKAGWAPIHIVARHGEAELMKTLVELNKFVKEEERSEPFDLNAGGGLMSYTPLHLSIFS